MIDPKDIRSIQVFHLNHLGDMIFSLPLLASIQQAFPRANIQSILRPPVVELWQIAGQGDEYLVRQKRQGWKRRMDLVRALRKRDPQVTFVLSQAYEPCLIAKLTGSPQRVGFTHTMMGWLLTDRVQKHGPPSLANNLNLLKAIGVEPSKQDYVGLLQPCVGDINRLQTRLAEIGVPSYKRLIVLGPGASPKRSVKEWTDEGFAAVGDYFSATKDTAVAIVGTTPAGPILKHARLPVIDLTGKTTLPELVSVLDRADLFIGVDSGALHIAGALGTPVVGLYGPSNEKITGPQGVANRVLTYPVPCHPCYQPNCSIGRPCLVNITSEDVINAATAVLTEAEVTRTMGI
ncbi:MAG: glycosyltransferase family 9 protein [Armatimonadota bacterium]